MNLLSSVTFLLPATGSVGRSNVIGVSYRPSQLLCFKMAVVGSAWEKRNTIHFPRACSSAEQTKCTDMLQLWGIDTSFPHSRFTVCSADKLRLGLAQSSSDFSASFTSLSYSDICDSSPASEPFKMRYYMVKKSPPYSQPVEKGRKGANSVTPRCPRKSGFKVSLLYCKVTCDVVSPCMFYSFF